MDVTAIRSSSLSSAAELLRRAKDTGNLRTEVTLNDLVLMLTAVNGFHANTLAARVAAARRFAALVIRAFQGSCRGD